MNKSKLIFVLLPILLSLACGQLSIQIEEPTPTIDPIEAIVQATLTASGIVSPTPTEASAVSPVWLSDPDIPSGARLPSIFSGLSYRDDSVWLVDQYGVSRLVMGQPANGALSPDGTGYLFSGSPEQGEDIYYYSMAGQLVSQWTDTPLIYESNYQWWPARPGVIVYNYVPQEEQGPWYGYLAAFDIATGERITIDGEYGSGSTFALSPDGESIAYNQGTQPMIYTWAQGSTEIDMQAMGLTFQSYQSPAWSPDGSKLAFHASGGESDPNTGAVISATVIIDLATNTARVLHEYASYGQRGGPEIAWSPDGQWLAVVNPGEIDPNGDPMAMWVLNAFDSTGIFLGFSTTPLWSPNGDYLVYVSWPPVGSGGPHEVVYVETGVWQPITITELGDAYPESWIYLP